MVKDMLKGISPLIAPELLMLLSEMGHGEEILLADANFPAGKFCSKVIQLPGADIPALLAAVMPLWTLDYKTQPFYMPAGSNGCDNRELAKLYLDIINRSNCDVPGMEFLSGEEFYTRAGRVRVCVVTGERRRFANLIIRKGVL